MLKSIGILVGAIAFGVALALLSIHATVMTGWIGGIFIISWTILTRKRWVKLQNTTGLEPGGPERVLRFYAVGTALLFGHSITNFAFPELDLHVGSGNYLAVDSWIMIAAMIAASFIVRQDKKIQDERDAAITSRGTKAGYLSLITILIGFSFVLGFLSPRFVETISYFTVANIQISIILASLLVKYVFQLLAYAQDTKADLAMDMGE